MAAEITDIPPYIPGADTPDDLRERARKLLPSKTFAHIIGGAGDERTTAANQAAFGRYRLLPRVLVDISNVDTSTEILGTKLAAPIFTSPMGGMGKIRGGERDLARAAAAAGVGFILTAWPGVTTEEVAEAAGPARWQQLYWQGNRAIMADLVSRAEAVGYRAIVLTVDTALIRATRRRWIRETYNKSSEQLEVTPNLRPYTTPEWQERVAFDRRGHIASEATEEVAISWKNAEWLRSLMHVPFVLKGIMTPEDALRAIEVGANAVMVSNHGGRILDGQPGTLEVLEDIVKAVDGKVPVLVDGGVRRASDIALALALGASAVGIGRPVLWALACGGVDTTTEYLEDLVDDLNRTFGIMGVRTVAEMTRERVSRKDQFLSDAMIAGYIPPP